MRVLCIADVRGQVTGKPIAISGVDLTRNALQVTLKSLNDLARQAKADFILHTGDFGFYDNTSLERIAEK